MLFTQIDHPAGGTLVYVDRWDRVAQFSEDFLEQATWNTRRLKVLGTEFIDILVDNGGARYVVTGYDANRRVLTGSLVEVHPGRVPDAPQSRVQAIGDAPDELASDSNLWRPDGPSSDVQGQ